MGKLLIHQELTLLALHDENGKFASSMYLYAVAGGMVSELLIQERIVANDDKAETAAVINDAKTGDELLDELLKQIGESKKHKGLRHWVTVAARMPKLQHRIAQQLVSQGILRQDEKKVLFVFTQQVYPELDGAYEDKIRQRMAELMFDPNGIPDVSTVILVALASHGNLLKSNFAPVELKQHAVRIKQLANGEILAAGATKAVIDAINTAVMVAVMVPAITAATAAN
jgi:siroheme synthase